MFSVQIKFLVLNMQDATIFCICIIEISISSRIITTFESELKTLTFIYELIYGFIFLQKEDYILRVKNLIKGILHGREETKF